MSDSPVPLIKESEIICRAAGFKGVFITGVDARGLRVELETETVGTFNLTPELINIFKEGVFTFGPGRQLPYSKMIYLSGKSNQKGSMIHESDCWAWNREEQNPYLTIYFRLSVSQRSRGVVFQPLVWGNCSGGATHRPTIKRCVRVLVGFAPDEHPLLEELAKSNHDLTVRFNDIGLGGVKSLISVFSEFLGNSERIEKLARSSLSPFEPDPYSKIPDFKDQGQPFVLEEDHPTLFSIWREQLREFREELV